MGALGVMLLPEEALDIRSAVLLGIGIATGLGDALLIGHSVGADRETVSRRKGWVNWSFHNSAELATMVGTRPGFWLVYLLLSYWRRACCRAARCPQPSSERCTAACEPRDTFGLVVQCGGTLDEAGSVAARRSDDAWGSQSSSCRRRAC